MVVVAMAVVPVVIVVPMMMPVPPVVPSMMTMAMVPDLDQPGLGRVDRRHRQRGGLRGGREE